MCSNRGMKNAIILHGMPSKESYLNPERDAQSNSHWLPWIQQQLLVKGVLAETPELPEPYEPKYEDWKKVFERYEVNDDTILIGHSCGAGFLVRYLSENKIQVGRVALVAPWIDPTHSLMTEFFDFEIDARVPGRAESMCTFISEDDDQEMLDSAQVLTEMWPSTEVMRMTDKGHFTLRDMGTREFPELKGYLLL